VPLRSPHRAAEHVIEGFPRFQHVPVDVRVVVVQESDVLWPVETRNAGMLIDDLRFVAKQGVVCVKGGRGRLLLL
jgi:hypothetical protein